MRTTTALGPVKPGMGCSVLQGNLGTGIFESPLNNAGIFDAGRLKGRRLEGAR